MIHEKLNKKPVLENFIKIEILGSSQTLRKMKLFLWAGFAALAVSAYDYVEPNYNFEREERGVNVCGGLSIYLITRKV